MKKAPKKFLVVLAAAISVFFLFVNAYAKEPYKIGALFAVTGPASFLGEPEKNTALMLKDQINKGGGINGHPLEIIIEDTKSDETQAVLSAKKLLENDKVLAIIVSYIHKDTEDVKLLVKFRSLCNSGKQLKPGF